MVNKYDFDLASAKLVKKNEMTNSNSLFLQ